MPTTREIQVYKFDELEEKAQQKVLDRMRYWTVEEIDWNESTVEWFEERLEDYGLEADGDLYWSAERGRDWWAYFHQGMEITNLKKLLKAAGYDLRKRLARAVTVDNPFDVAVNTYAGSRGAHNIIVPFFPEGNITEKEVYEVANELTDFINNTIMEEFLNSTEKEYDYLTSDECLKENIEANDYDFLENGEVAP